MIDKRMFTPQLLLNWITRILFFVSLSALLPTLPNYLNDMGGNNSQIGIVMSAFALGVLIFRPMVGKQIDNVGRKIVLILGTLIFVISPIFYIFIHSIGVLLPIRVFHGLGLAAFGTASITLITDAAPRQSRGAVISYTGMVNTIAFAVGPILGSFVGDKWGYNVLFAIVSAIAFVCLIVTMFLQETKTHQSTIVQSNYFQAIKQRRILVAAAIILLIGLTHGGVMFYIPIFLKDNVRGNIGLFFAVYGTAALVIRFVIGPASDRWGRGPFMVSAMLLLTAAVITLSQTTSIALMFTAAALYGLGFGAQQPTLTALIADNTTEETRGKVFSFYYGGFDLGISLAGVVLGTIADQFGIKNMFIACSSLTLTALIIFTTIIEHTVSESFRCALSLQKSGASCYICDQYQEVSPKQAEEYFKS